MQCLNFFNGTYLRECIEAIGSQTFRLGLNFSPVCKHIVPSLPPRNKHIVFTKNINCLDFINGTYLYNIESYRRPQLQMKIVDLTQMALTSISPSEDLVSPHSIDNWKNQNLPKRKCSYLKKDIINIYTTSKKSFLSSLSIK